jgi:hypothetical protein
MASNDYHFTTHWRVRGDIEEVYSILADGATLARWWPAAYREAHPVDLGDGQAGRNAVYMVTRGWLPYTLGFRCRLLESRAPTYLRVEAQGELDGEGVWRLAQDGPWVDVIYEWTVKATKPLLRYLSFLLRPLFAVNHDWVMMKGEESLKVELARRHARTPAEQARIPAPPGPSPITPLLSILAVGLTLGGAVLLYRKLTAPQAGRQSFHFDPDRIAYFEANGWRSYYERDWRRLLQLLVGMNQEQFRIPFPLSILAAYYVTRASIAWVPVDHDEAVVRSYYEKFYRMAARYSGLRFDPVRVGELELRYNDDHRRLVGQADKTPFIETMVQLHSTTFGIAPEQARESAELRVLANNTVDKITGKTSTDVEGDWRRLEEYLRQCYRSIDRALAARKGPAPAGELEAVHA